MASELQSLYFNVNTITCDFFHLICSERLGKGVAREVYRSAFDPTMVFKFEKDAGSFQNIMEWETWQNVKFTADLKNDYAQYFAPCLGISPCGTILAQRYARPLQDEELPKELPAFFTDIKKSNFGILNNKVVCVDYGNNLLMTRGLTHKKIKADW
jgi:hypothetical protein